MKQFSLITMIGILSLLMISCDDDYEDNDVIGCITHAYEENHTFFVGEEAQFESCSPARDAHYQWEIQRLGSEHIDSLQGLKITYAFPREGTYWVKVYAADKNGNILEKSISCTVKESPMKELYFDSHDAFNHFSSIQNSAGDYVLYGSKIKTDVGTSTFLMTTNAELNLQTYKILDMDRTIRPIAIREADFGYFATVQRYSSIGTVRLDNSGELLDPISYLNNDSYSEHFMLKGNTAFFICSQASLGEIVMHTFNDAGMHIGSFTLRDELPKEAKLLGFKKLAEGNFVILLKDVETNKLQTLTIDEQLNTLGFRLIDYTMEVDADYFDFHVDQENTMLSYYGSSDFNLQLLFFENEKLLWSKKEKTNERANLAIEKTDGGYFLFGDKFAAKKFNKQGILWERTYHPSSYLYSVLKDNNNSFILFGQTLEGVDTQESNGMRLVGTRINPDGSFSRD